MVEGYSSTCTSCGGDPDTVIKNQRNMLDALARRAHAAESQAEMLRESNKSLEKRVDWADRLRAQVDTLDIRAVDAERMRDILRKRVEMLLPVFDAAMDHYENQAEPGMQAAMFAACSKVET